MGIDRVTQEFTHDDRRRSDLIIWRNRASGDALLCSELKTPTTPLRNARYQRDVITKARAQKAPYLALWNMRELKMFRTPEFPQVLLLPSDEVPLHAPIIQDLQRVADWLKPSVEAQLHDLARTLVRAVTDLITTGAVGGRVLDATIFVGVLAERISQMRPSFETDVRTAMRTNRALARRLRNWAGAQGLEGFVEDVATSFAAQIAYRLLGQSLFYYSYRRQEPSLPALGLHARSSATAQLRGYWDKVRAFDYEALYEPSPLEEIPLSAASDDKVREFVQQLAGYDWDNVSIDVLGAIFEQMIPTSERQILGQYYTPPTLVDLVLSLALLRPPNFVLDPGAGTGTFLYRCHNRYRTFGSSHQLILERAWGFDISAFAAELAVINLCRQDLTSQQNFPRVSVRDFFSTQPDTEIEFPPAQRFEGGGEAFVKVPIPKFDAVLGNPPYVRSQQLDDLDPAYKGRLQTLARQAGFGSGPKLDAFAYFIIHADKFLLPGGKLGFVTSAAWLTAEYGTLLKRFLLGKYRIDAVVWSQVEAFFPTVDYDTVVLIATRLPTNELTAPRGPIRFITLTRRVAEVTRPQEEPGYWDRVDGFVDAITTAGAGDHDGYRVVLINGDEERAAIQQFPGKARNWARWLRRSQIYSDVFGG